MLHPPKCCRAVGYDTVSGNKTTCFVVINDFSNQSVYRFNASIYLYVKEPLMATNKRREVRAV